MKKLLINISFLLILICDNFYIINIKLYQKKFLIILGNILYQFLLSWKSKIARVTASAHKEPFCKPIP